LPFECNLQRYTEACRLEATQRWLEINAALTENGGSVRGGQSVSDWASEVGLCTLNQVDP
jgi:hypothetical protein